MAISSPFGSFIIIEGFLVALEYISIVGTTKVSPLPLLVVPIIRLLTGLSSI